MKPVTASIADATNHFAAHLRSAESGQAVLITRRGKTIAALVPAGQIASPANAGTRKTGLAAIAGGWPEADELVEALIEGRRTPPRKLRRVLR